jgi:hypothetical protein
MIIEVTKIDWVKVRTKCIQMNWYTRGTCEEYSKMLDMCDDTYSVQLLEKIAQDIVAHSEDCWEGYDDSPKLNVMFELRTDCCYCYFEEI